MSKREDIREYIRIYALHPDIRNLVISGQVKAALLKAQNKEDPEKVISSVWKTITKDDYIEQFIDSFDKVFTHEEIIFLLNFYKSDVMKKYNYVGKDLFTKVFKNFHNLIQDVVKSSS